MNVRPSLIGTWAIKPEALRSLQTRVASMQPAANSMTPNPGASEAEYERCAGAAVIDVIGVLVKYDEWYNRILGLTSTVSIQRQLSAALADSGVDRIILRIDTPGGMVAGSTELAEAVAAANRIKPVYACCSDLVASGGYWIASQARYISLNDVGQAGSIGVYVVLTDDSQFWGKVGVTFTVVSTGGVKGLGADGKVSEALIADCQREIDAIYERFIAAVAKGRGLTTSAVKALADGRSWHASEAMSQKLIDVVYPCEPSIQLLATRNGGGQSERMQKQMSQTKNEAPPKPRTFGKMIGATVNLSKEAAKAEFAKAWTENITDDGVPVQQAYHSQDAFCGWCMAKWDEARRDRR